MIKAVFLGLVAAGAAVAAEMGTDQLLAMRAAQSTAVVAKATETRKTHEINVPPSRTAWSRATR
jgi:hypothetical protein